MLYQREIGCFPFLIISMPDSRRLRQMNQVLKEHVSRFLEQELREPEIGLLTVTRVEVTPDLAEAKIWVSSYARDKSLSRIVKYLRSINQDVYRSLRDVLTTKRVPKIRFMIDENGEYADRIDQLLKQARIGTVADSQQ